MAEYKAKAVIEVKKGERIYSFECENNCPLGEIYDSLNEMRNMILKTINEHEQKQAEEKPKEASA